MTTNRNYRTSSVRTLSRKSVKVTFSRNCTAIILYIGRDSPVCHRARRVDARLNKSALNGCRRRAMSASHNACAFLSMGAAPIGVGKDGDPISESSDEFLRQRYLHRLCPGKMTLRLRSSAYLLGREHLAREERDTELSSDRSCLVLVQRGGYPHDTHDLKVFDKRTEVEVSCDWWRSPNQGARSSSRRSYSFRDMLITLMSSMGGGIGAGNPEVAGQLNVVSV